MSSLTDACSTRRASWSVGAAIASLALLGGCGPSAGPAATDETQYVALTPAALAWIATEHAARPSSAAAADDAGDAFTIKPVEVELRYDATGEDDGAALTVAVGRGADPMLTGCVAAREAFDDRCVETPQGLVLWEVATPEEDPGVVYVASTKRGRGDGRPVTALAWYSGDDVTGDPRELDLGVGVATMFDIVGDPRVDLLTPDYAVEAGEELGYYR